MRLLAWAVLSSVSCGAGSEKYIVKLRSELRVGLQAHLANVKEMFTDRSGANSIDRVYHALGSMYSANLTPSMATRVKGLGEVEFVEPDGLISAEEQQADATWGLDRISHTNRSMIGNYTYQYDGDGEGVIVYVLDTGILIEHAEFGGRASHGATFQEGIPTDNKGHGTHCAGTIGSASYGVAKRVELVGVKILNGTGKGSISTTLVGIDWVVSEQRGKRGNIISMLVGGGKSDAINAAIEAASHAGILPVVSAGNSNIDACLRSPASSPYAITVGAIDSNDTRARFSNYGSCVDIFAPGVQILSTWNDGTTKSISGTSMATPHVSGLAATLMSKSPCPQRRPRKGSLAWPSRIKSSIPASVLPTSLPTMA